MKKKDEIIKDLGFDFNEANDLFSEETLSTMEMDLLRGGTGDGNKAVNCGDKTFCGQTCTIVVQQDSTCTTKPLPDLKLSNCSSLIKGTSCLILEPKSLECLIAAGFSD